MAVKHKSKSKSKSRRGGVQDNPRARTAKPITIAAETIASAHDETSTDAAVEDFAGVSEELDAWDGFAPNSTFNESLRRGSELAVSDEAAYSILLSRVEEMYRAQVEHQARRRAALDAEMLDIALPGLGDDVPSLAMVRFDMPADVLRAEEGSAVWTSFPMPGGPVDAEYRVRESHAITGLSEAAAQYDARGMCLRITLGTSGEPVGECAAPDPLRLHFGGDDGLKVVDALIHPTTTIRMVRADGAGTSITAAPAIAGCGIKTRKSAFSGYGLFRALAAAPRTFASVDLFGVSAGIVAENRRVELIVEGPRIAEACAEIGTWQLTTNTFPAVNISRFSAQLACDGTRLFLPIQADVGHRVLNIDRVDLIDGQGGEHRLASLYGPTPASSTPDNSASTCEARYAIVRPPAVESARTGKDGVRAEVDDGDDCVCCLHLVDPHPDVNAPVRRGVHVMGWQFLPELPQNLSRQPLATDLDAGVRLVGEPSKPLLAPVDAGALLRRALSASNPLWHDDPADAAEALRGQMLLWGLGDWRAAEGAGDGGGHIRLMHELAAAVMGLSARQHGSGGVDETHMTLTLVERRGVPLVLLAHVIAAALSWLTMDSAVRLTVRIIRGRGDGGGNDPNAGSADTFVIPAYLRGAVLR